MEADLNVTKEKKLISFKISILGDVAVGKSSIARR